MPRSRSSRQNESSTRGTGSGTLTRRRALALIGSGVVAGGVGRVGAQSVDTDAEAEVWSEGDTWHAEAHGSTVYSGGDMFEAVQSAIDGLTSGRDEKETVLVRDGGEASGQITLPDYTALDFRGTIEHSGGVPIYADGAHAIELTNYALEGSADMGMRIQRCSDVVLGTIAVVGAGLGVRIDDAYDTGNGVTTENVRIDYAYVEGTGSHGVETYGVDDIEIGTVQARDTGGCGLLLNDTSNASVGYVDSVRANEGGGYAGFRCANDAGPDIHVERVRSIDCGRGIFTVSGSEGITVEEVYLEGNGGNLIQNTSDVSINGGTVLDNGGEGFRVDSRDSGSHPPTRNVTIRNCVIHGHSYGIRETGPDTGENEFADNDLCENDTAVETYASSTTVSGNTTCERSPGEDPGPADSEDPAVPEDSEEPEDAGESCEDAEPSPVDPYLRVDGGDWQNEGEVTVDAGSTVEFGPHPHEGGSWEWDGPGVSSSDREIVVTPDETSTYTATYANDCEETSTYEFTVTVEEGEGEDGEEEEEDSSGACDGDGIRVGEGTACDPDGDGRYEDVDGSGSAGSNDVVAFFEHLESDAVQENPEAFDFNDSGGVGFDDVVALFEAL